MPESSTALFIFIGLVAGLLSGVFGIGGGVVIVPALIYLAGFTQHRATGTSLAVLLPPIGFAAMWEYYRHDNVSVSAAMIIAAAVFVGGWLGAVVANRVSGPYLRLAFGIFVVVLGISERSGGLDGSEIEGLHRSSVAESAKTSVAATGWVSFVANTSESSGTKGAADRRCST